MIHWSCCIALFLAGSLAAGVAGVRAVQNDIDISVPRHRADYEIAQDVEARLRLDPRLSSQGGVILPNLHVIPNRSELASAGRDLDAPGTSA